MVCIAAASVSVAATLIFNAYAGITFAVLSSLCFCLLYRGSGSDASHKDIGSVQFVGNLIDNYSDSVSTLKLLDISLSPELWFNDSMREAMSRYTMHGDAKSSFSKLLASDSAALREISAAIVQRLDSGTGMLGPLKEIKRRISAERKYKLKALGGTLNANSVARLGSALFVPTFAGISLQIVRFTGQGFSDAKAWTLVAVFAFYIISANMINFRYSHGDPMSNEKSALSSAIGIIVFKISSMLSILML